MKNVSKAITNIYNERGDFIIIGLTGRTGSGCTEAAKILCSDSFNNLNLSPPKSSDFNNVEERKNRVVYKYAEEHWDKGFQCINMSSIICSFVFQNSFESFIKEIQKYNHIEIGLIREIDNVINDLNVYKKEYNSINEDLSKYIENNGLDHTFTKNDNKAQEIVYLLSKIDDLSIKIKNTLKKYEIEKENVNKITEKVIEKDINQMIEKYKLDNTVEDIYNPSCKIKQKEEIKDTSSQLYTFLFQMFGNNIRASGKAFSNKFTGKNMFCLAERANDFIKAIKFVNRKNDKHTLICIDAIRNPFEATYFKDRYSAFYLISINTNDNERLRRLSNIQNINIEQINSLDEIEYPKKLKPEEKFYKQDIRACLELADIHIHNPEADIKEKYFFTEQLVKYYMLMKHPGLITPTNIERCMQVAYNAKLNSGCLSRQVGATITDENYCIKSIGWNDVPHGQVPCNLRDMKSFFATKDIMTYSKHERVDEKFNIEMSKKYRLINQDALKGRVYSYCFKDMWQKVTGEKNQVHTRSLHAEENSFLQIVKYGGQGIKGGNLFTTASPCELCSKKAYQLGIKKIYYIDPYPGISKDHILTHGENNPNNPKMNLFFGAIGQAYTALYTQRVALKDELEMLIE